MYGNKAIMLKVSSGGIKKMFQGWHNMALTDVLKRTRCNCWQNSIDKILHISPRIVERRS